MSLDQWLAIAAMVLGPTLGGVAAVNALRQKVEVHAVKIEALEKSDTTHRTAIENLTAKVSDLREYLAREFGELKARLR